MAAGKRTATSLAKKLEKIDRQIDRQNHKGNYNTADLEAKKTTLIKEAKQKGLKMVSVGVADGSAIYYEAKRTTKLATFEFLYGGGDCYVDDWGKIIAVPLAAADDLIKRFNPNYL